MKKILLSTALVLSTGVSVYAGGGGDTLRASFMMDTLEKQNNETDDIVWGSYGYIGYDINKVYIYTEGSNTKNGETESENQLVYSRAISPYWDAQIGVAYDTVPGNNNTWGVVALQGLTPYFFETRTSLLVDGNGNIGLRAEAEYDMLFTQKLILTPSIGFSAYTKDDKDMEIGKGFSNLTLGARLRYEFRREFAPYIGVEWAKNFGNTDDISPLDEVYVTAGIRFWF